MASLQEREIAAMIQQFLFSCPTTGQEIDPGVDDAGTNKPGNVRFTALHVRCPHCGEHHEIKIEDEALTAAA